MLSSVTYQSRTFLITMNTIMGTGVNIDTAIGIIIAMSDVGGSSENVSRNKVNAVF